MGSASASEACSQQCYTNRRLLTVTELPKQVYRPWQQPRSYAPAHVQHTIDANNLKMSLAVMYYHKEYFCHLWTFQDVPFSKQKPVQSKQTDDMTNHWCLLPNGAVKSGWAQDGLLYEAQSNLYRHILKPTQNQ